MIKEKVIAAYEKMAVRYNELIDHKPHNAYYDRPNTLALLPDVKGKTVLDAACGPGKYAEILIDQGANVIGYDISPKMVELAIQRNQNQRCNSIHNPHQNRHGLDKTRRNPTHRPRNKVFVLRIIMIEDVSFLCCRQKQIRHYTDR